MCTTALNSMLSMCLTGGISAAADFAGSPATSLYRWEGYCSGVCQRLQTVNAHAPKLDCKENTGAQHVITIAL